MNIHSAYATGLTFVFEGDDASGYSVGDSVVVSGATPAGYNGTFTLIAITPRSVTAVIASNPGPYMSGGVVT